MPGRITPFQPRDPNDGSPFGAPGLNHPSGALLPWAAASLAAWYARGMYDHWLREAQPLGTYNLTTGTPVPDNGWEACHGYPVNRNGGMYFYGLMKPSCTHLWDTKILPLPVFNGTAQTGWYASHHHYDWVDHPVMPPHYRVYIGHRHNVSAADWNLYVVRAGWMEPMAPEISVHPNFDPMAQPIGQTRPAPVPVPPALAPYMPQRPEGSDRLSPGRLKPRKPRDRYRPRPRRKGEKEAKFRITPTAAALHALMEYMTESLDAVEAIWRAIPGNEDKNAPGPEKMFNDIWKNFHKLELVEVIKQLMIEAAVDKVVGDANAIGAKDPAPASAKRGIGIILRHYL